MIAQVELGSDAMLDTDDLGLIKAVAIKALKKGIKVKINGKGIKNLKALVEELKELKKQVITNADIILVGDLKNKEQPDGKK